MKKLNAVKKLGEFGKVERGDGSKHYAVKGCWMVSFLCNGAVDDEAEIVCVKARRISDEDNIQEDYSGGSFFPTLNKAIAWASREN